MLMYDLLFYRLDAEKMGMVCTVALMGDPMAEAEKGSKGTLLALERMQQVIASNGRYNTSKAPLFPSYIASEEDLKNVNVEEVQLVSMYYIHHIRPKLSFSPIRLLLLLLWKLVA